jgi:hypothetical protein
MESNTTPKLTTDSPSTFNLEKKTMSVISLKNTSPQEGYGNI